MAPSNRSVLVAAYSDSLLRCGSQSSCPSGASCVSVGAVGVCTYPNSLTANDTTAPASVRSLTLRRLPPHASSTCSRFAFSSHIFSSRVVFCNVQEGELTEYFHIHPQATLAANL